MSDARKDYPDISDILTRKAEGRRQRALLTFAEKLAALDEMRARAEPIVRARKRRQSVPRV